jgi:hypothetical protein
MRIVLLDDDRDGQFYILEENNMNRYATFLIAGILAVSLLLSAVACNNTGDKPEDNDIFSIYVLPERVEGAPPYNLDEFELPEKPFLSVDDIDYYDFSTHYIYLNIDKASLFDEGQDKYMSSAFIVVADGERCYLGHFHSIVMSWMPPTPVISYDPEFGFYPDDIIYIQNYSIDGADDPRDDPRIEEALSRVGKLRHGISVMLEEVNIDDRDGLTVVSYTFTITNEGDETLYLFDPDRVGAERFHYYTGGLYLSGADFFFVVLSDYDTTKEQFSYDEIDPLWYTKLKSHESVKRTVDFECDTVVPDGVYSAYLVYTCPSYIEKNDRSLKDGRLWLGSVRSNSVEITE